MPKFIVRLTIPAVDAQGKDHRAREEMDIYPQLSPTAQANLVTLNNRIVQLVQTLYPGVVELESMRFEP